jgi:hypothetical protein
MKEDEDGEDYELPSADISESLYSIKVFETLNLHGL